MKNILIIFVLLPLITLNSNSLFANSAIPFPNEIAELMVTLRAGTVVSVTTNEEIQADEIQVGNSIDFFVRSNVTVNGQVVIASGAIAEGWVKKVMTSCDGRCSKITITVENVQTVDGQRIYLRSIPHTVKIDCCGDSENEAVITIGTNISARVLNDVNINS